MMHESNLDVIITSIWNPQSGSQVDDAPCTSQQEPFLTRHHRQPALGSYSEQAEPPAPMSNPPIAPTGAISLAGLEGLSRPRETASDTSANVSLAAAAAAGACCFACGVAVGVVLDRYAYSHHRPALSENVAPVDRASQMDARDNGGDGGRETDAGVQVTVSQLWIYPIKSCAALAVESACVTPRGLENDRLFMVVDFTRRFMTQRMCPQLALIRPRFTESGDLELAANEVKPFVLTPLRDGETQKVTVWKDECDAVDQGDAVAQWLATALDHSGVRLVRMTESFVRKVESGYVKHGGVHQTSFSDGYPFLLASEESLADVSSRVGRPMEMRRFRPNIVVCASEGKMEPFAEDTWASVRVGDECEFELAKMCSRCKLPTIDPGLGEFDKDNQPTVALREYRVFEKKVMFGQNMVATKGGECRAVVSVGDQVRVLTRRQAPKPDEA